MVYIQFLFLVQLPKKNDQTLLQCLAMPQRVIVSIYTQIPTKSEGGSFTENDLVLLL